MHVRTGFIAALLLLPFVIYQPLSVSAGTVLIAPASVKGTLSTPVFFAMNSGGGPALRALSVGGMALDASTASPRGLALSATNTSTTGGSAVVAYSFGNTIQASSQHANAVVGRTRLLGTQAYNAAGVIGLDLTSSIYNQGVKGFSTSGMGVLGEGAPGIVGGVNYAFSCCGSPPNCPNGLGELSAIQAFGIASSASLAGGRFTNDGCTNTYGTGVTADASVGVLAQGEDYFDASSAHFGIGIQAQGSMGAMIIGQGPNPLYPVPAAPALQVEEQQPGLIITAHGPAGGMSLDTSGNLVISGTLTQNGTPQGMKTPVIVGESFAGSEGRQTLSSVGEAQLSAGVSFVKLSATFASHIQRGVNYEVFVTPNGPTAGLYVTQRSPSGFVVRENPGGHSNTVFNYRIVAQALEKPSNVSQGRPATKSDSSKPMDLILSRRMLNNLRISRARYIHTHAPFLRK